MYRKGDEVIWMAKADSPSEARYVAFFNLGDTTRTVSLSFDSVVNMKGEYKVRDLWKEKNLGIFRGSFSAHIGPRSAGLFKLQRVKH